jgi:hypothetical protein
MQTWRAASAGKASKESRKFPGFKKSCLAL